MQIIRGNREAIQSDIGSSANKAKGLAILTAFMVTLTINIEVLDYFDSFDIPPNVTVLTAIGSFILMIAGVRELARISVFEDELDIHDRSSQL